MYCGSNDNFFCNTPVTTRIKARFFQITTPAGTKTFGECIKELAERCKTEPWIETTKELHFHVSRVEEADGFLTGELIRRQTSDIPPQAPDDAVLVPQPTPIGHRCAFRYMPVRDTILMEVRKSSVSPNQLNLILAKHLGVKGTLIVPVLRTDAWERLGEKHVTKFFFRVAHPENLEPLDEPEDITTTLLTLRNALGAPQIEISASFPPYEQGWLSTENVKRFAANLMRQVAGGSVQKVQLKLDNESDILDLIKDHVKVEREIELDDGDVDRHYESRKQFLKESFEEFLGDNGPKDSDA